MIIDWYEQTLTLPINKNPLLLHIRDADCNHDYEISGDMGCIKGKGTQNSQVFYLSGTIGHPAREVKRNCTISVNNEQRKFLLVPILTKICDDVEYKKLDSDKKMRDCVEAFLKRPSNKTEVTINNQPIADLEGYKMMTGNFPVNLKEDGLYSLHGVTGRGSARAGGYWILIEIFSGAPLTIHSKGETQLVSAEEDKTVNYIGGTNFLSDVYYNITVK